MAYIMGTVSLFYLTPASISHFNLFLLALLVTVYLVFRFRRQEQLSQQDRLLLLFFLSLTAFSLALFLDVSLLPSESLLAIYLENPILSLLVTFLMQFAYVFPHPQEKQKIERRVALLLTILYWVGETVYAAWRYLQLSRGHVEYRYEFFDIPLLLAFVWIVVVFLRGAFQNWKQPASRRFALIFLIPVALAALNLLTAASLTGATLYHISLSVGILAAIAFFSLNYLASKPETTSLLVKITGVTLTSSLAVFGTVPWLVTPAYVERYEPSIPDHRTIRFTPNAEGGYDVNEIPFTFERDLGENLESIFDPLNRGQYDVSGFPFPFYGKQYDHIHILNYGILVFGREIDPWDLEYRFADVPAIFPLYLAFNDKVNPQSGVFLNRTAERLVVTFYNREPYFRSGNNYTYQITLHTDGAFNLTYNGLPPEIHYFVNDRPNASPWVIGVQPGGSTPQRTTFTDLPLSTGPQGALQDEYHNFRQSLHGFLLPLAIAILVSSLMFIIGVPLTLNVMLARPLNILLKGVVRFNQGERAQIPAQFNDEIGFLTRSFNDMGTELDNLIRTLEQRVAERTSDLVAANEQLRKLSRAVEQSPSSIVITDHDALIEYVNPAFTRSTGYTFEEAKGRNPRILKSKLTSPEAYVDMWDTLTAGKTWRGELCNRRKNGEIYWEYSVIAPIQDAHGYTTHYVAVKEDVTARKATELSLLESERQYRDLFELESDAIFIIRNSDGQILEANSAASTLYGYSREEFTRLGNTDLSAEPEATQKATHSPVPVNQVIHIPLRWHRKKAGEVFPVEITARFITWKGEDVHLAAIRDISERKKIEDELNRLAITDPLTELFDRRHFFAEAEKIYLRCKHPPYDLAVLMIDIDHFKQVNDTYGHPAGDLVLREAADRIRQSLRPTDLLGRYGGEEFIAVLSRTHYADAAQIADRLIRSISDQPVAAQGQNIPITVSIGIARLEESTNSFDELVSNADRALYQAKGNGRNCWSAFEPSRSPSG